LANFPVEVLEISSMIQKCSGIHHDATRPARNARGPGLSTVCPGTGTTQVSGRSPVLVGDRDDRGLVHVGVRHDLVFQRHRGDPLPTGFHQVLGPVDDAQVTMAVKRPDVAVGSQPSAVKAACPVSAPK